MDRGSPPPFASFFLDKTYFHFSSFLGILGQVIPTLCEMPMPPHFVIHLNRRTTKLQFSPIDWLSNTVTSFYLVRDPHHSDSLTMGRSELTKETLLYGLFLFVYMFLWRWWHRIVLGRDILNTNPTPNPSTKTKPNPNPTRNTITGPARCIRFQKNKVVHEGVGEMGGKEGDGIVVWLCVSAPLMWLFVGKLVVVVTCV